MRSFDSSSPAGPAAGQADEGVRVATMVRKNCINKRPGATGAAGDFFAGALVAWNPRMVADAQ